MTRKDFELIAAALAAAIDKATEYDRDGEDFDYVDIAVMTAGYVADNLEQDNPRFDIQRFLATIKREEVK